MSMEHAVTQTIFDSLLHSPKGFDFDQKRAALVLSQLKGDPAATTAFHEVLGMLELSNGKPAAEALRNLLLQPAPAKKAGWGSR